MIPGIAAALPALYRWGAIAAIGTALFAFGWLQGAHREQIKAERFESATEGLGKAQAARAKAIEAQQQDNLKQVTHDLLANIQAAGDVAVANYRARYGVQQCPGRSTVPEPATGQSGNDGEGTKRLALFEPGFINACALDAARLTAWQKWATLNRIPVAD